MTCEFCDGLGAVLITDVNEKKITDKDVFKEKIIPYEYGEDDFIAITVSTPATSAANLAALSVRII